MKITSHSNYPQCLQSQRCSGISPLSDAGIPRLLLSHLLDVCVVPVLGIALEDTVSRVPRARRQYAAARCCFSRTSGIVICRVGVGDAGRVGVGETGCLRTGALKIRLGNLRGVLGVEPIE